MNDRSDTCRSSSYDSHFYRSWVWRRAPLAVRPSGKPYAHVSRCLISQSSGRQQRVILLGGKTRYSPIGQCRRDTGSTFVPWNGLSRLSTPCWPISVLSNPRWNGRLGRGFLLVGIRCGPGGHLGTVRAQVFTLAVAGTRIVPANRMTVRHQRAEFGEIQTRLHGCRRKLLGRALGPRHVLAPLP